MRTVVLTAYLICYSLSYSQDASLKVYPYDCRGGGQSVVYKPSEIQLYQQDSLIETSGNYIDSAYVEFKNLSDGKYELRFTDFYGVEKRHQSVITKVVMNTELICVYDSKWSKWKGESFLDSLKESEEIVIRYESSGCFHQIHEEIRITLIDKKYFIHFKEQTNELSKEQLSALRIFESELKEERSNGCTTQDRYLILLNNSGRSYTDGSCSWNGFYRLKEKLELQ